MDNTQEFQPNWVSAPGDTISEILAEQQKSLAMFADDIGKTVAQAKRLLDGRMEICEDVAKRLQHSVGSTQAFWLRREADYRADMERLYSEQAADTNKAWLDQLPVSDMIKYGWINASRKTTDRLNACLDFFDIPHVGAWRENYGNLAKAAAFRTSTTFDIHPGAVIAWLRKGEIEAEKIDCLPWNEDKFRNSLSKIRKLTTVKDPAVFLPELRNICARCGVAVVTTRTPTGCRANGATRFLSTDKAVIMLSFRYLSDDQFWFTFFHEAGHLILHSDKALFIEDNSEVTSHEEDEANRFAEDYLIPRKFRDELYSLRLGPQPMRNALSISRFARKIGIAPGIIVGQLQHKGMIMPNMLNKMKTRYKWEDIEGS